MRATSAKAKPLFWFALLLSVLAACNGGTIEVEAPDDDAGPSFIATESDFANFTSWAIYDGGTVGLDGLDGGQRNIYLNEIPAPGSQAFPLGTILIKTTEGDATFAMVKRGGGFNPNLAGWEWFQLALSDGTAPLGAPGVGAPTSPASGLDGGAQIGVQILWRGTGPNGTLSYGNAAATSCNSCHFNAFSTDFVYGPPGSAVHF